MMSKNKTNTPIVSNATLLRSYAATINYQQDEIVQLQTAAKRQDERILKLQQCCLDVRDAANKLVRGERPALQNDDDEFQRLVGKVNTPDLLELPQTIKERLEAAENIERLMPSSPKVKLAALTEYSDDGHDATVYINPDEVSAVRYWKYHSFRPAITEIILQNGTKFHVWQDVETALKRLNETASG